MKKSNLITTIIIIFVIILAIWILKNPGSDVSEELARCIGEKSELYTQLGCTHCETQEKMFGSSYKYLKVTDCWFNRDICTDKDITSTPTWIINNEKYRGVQSIEKLQELTGC